MLIPVAGVALLLALLAEEKDVFPHRVYRRAKDEDWLPGEEELEALRVPRRWFHSHPHLVPPPFAWPSTRTVGIAEHPYRTAHVLLTIDNFIDLTSTGPGTLQRKTERMRQRYLPIAERMLRGEEPANFPPPWLQLVYDDHGEPRIVGHEGRHRAMLARDLGLAVLPVVLVMARSIQGWEHGPDSIDTDPVVDRVTQGKAVWVWSQDHGPGVGRPSRYMQLVPMSPQGTKLGYEMARLQLTLDPRKRHGS